MAFFEEWGGYPLELAWWTGGGRPRALVAGEGWGGRRGDGNSKEGGGGLVGLFLKDALWGGGGYPPELAWWTGR